MQMQFQTAEMLAEEYWLVINDRCVFSGLFSHADDGRSRTGSEMLGGRRG